MKFLSLTRHCQHLLLALLLLAVASTQAQTKVFKEVSDEISSQLEIIRQDGNLVGYLLFTQLEKASADSFNYRLSIMDENLNDIGAVKFRDEKLILKGVSFEQDVLCLTYVKSNFVGIEYKNGRDFRREKDNARAELLAQFINLNGKILNRYTVKMDIKPESQSNNYNRKVIGDARLKQQIQLRNISGRGFACFYGDDSRNSLLIFNTAGKLTWQKTVREEATGFLMLTSGDDVDLLLKKKEKMEEGGYAIIGYNTKDTSTYPKFLLKDRKGRSLKVLTFENDPVSGKPYVSGLVIDSVKGNNYGTGRALVHGTYSGIFSIALNGHRRNDIQPVFTYWSDGSQGELVNKRGYYKEARAYPNLESSFKDYQGNTYFFGPGIHRRFRTGSVIVSTVFAISVVIPAVVMAAGTHTFSSRNMVIVKQTPAGKLSLESAIPLSNIMGATAKYPLRGYDLDSYTVTNPETKSNYLVIDNSRKILIYNIEQHKLARTIPHEDANSYITLLPAKEGHVMVSEYDKKQKQTRLSIEAL
ncbi:MAG: hypothetical protein JST68_05950 [Bacteroidetes bacterium]|nr:hypothetical protein [Bacteroidota bacterium]